jgi:hypothetical protein
LKLTKLGARELTLDADADALAITLALEYINQGSIDGRVTPMASWYYSSGEQIRASDR